MPRSSWPASPSWRSSRTLSCPRVLGSHPAASPTLSTARVSAASPRRWRNFLHPRSVCDEGGMSDLPDLLVTRSQNNQRMGHFFLFSFSFSFSFFWLFFSIFAQTGGLASLTLTAAEPPRERVYRFDLAVMMAGTWRDAVHDFSCEF